MYEAAMVYTLIGLAYDALAEKKQWSRFWFCNGEGAFYFVTSVVTILLWPVVLGHQLFRGKKND